MMFARRPFGIMLVLALTGASLLSAGNASSADAPGAVYALTNSPSGNAVVVYNRGADGSLTPAGWYASGGTGTGAGLGSQDAVIVTADHRLLFAVNPGSDSISSFRIHPDGLELIDTAPSGGTMPTSVTFRAGLLYVLNAGVPNSVTGFTVSPAGKLTGQRAACWAIVTTNGRYGYVTNAGTGNISGFAIDQDGSVSLLDADGITAVTGGNPTDIAISQDSRFLYARVSALSQIAVFRIGSDGSLRPLPPLTGTPGGLAGLAGF